MPDNASPRLRLRKQETNANNNIWGTYLNDDVIELIDEAIAGVTAVAVNGAVSLTSVNFDPDQARRAVLIFTGAGGFDVTIPAVEKVYVVHNKAAAAIGVKTGGGAVASVGAGSRALVYSDGVDVVSVANNATQPVGSVMDFAGSAAPSGWLLCAGQAVSRTTYAALFAVIGTTWGAGDGTTTFNVPDLRGRVTAGKDDMGGSAAGRLTNSGTGNPGINGAALGAAGGVDRVTLTQAQLASHAHAVTDPTHTHGKTETAHTHTSLDHIHQWYDYGAGLGSNVIDGTNVSGNAASWNSTADPIPIADPLASDYYTTGKTLRGGAIADVNGATSNVSINAASTGISLSNNGSSEAHPNAQPTAIVNKIIYTGL